MGLFLGGYPIKIKLPLIAIADNYPDDTILPNYLIMHSPGIEPGLLG